MNIRSIKPSDCALLRDFLYLAIHQKDPNKPVPQSVVDIPEVYNYIDAYGTKEGDDGLLAEIEGQVVAMVWVRILSGELKGYGYIDEETPEFAISVIEKYRAQGIGQALMKQMINRLKDKNYTQCSLSIEKGNRAIKLYERLGFNSIKETSDDYIMVKKLNR